MLGMDIIEIILMLIKMILIFAVMMLLAAYLGWAERRLLGFIQDRLGPNRTGFQGLLQPMADFVKLLTKEDFCPDGADRFLFYFAPAIAAIPAIMTFCVVPFGGPVTIMGRTVNLQMADVNVGILVFMALSSITVYSVAIGGWASNSKYSLLGSIRGLAQLISYELSMGLSLVPVVMLARSLKLSEIVNAQADVWFVAKQPLAFLIFLISIIAECKRTPFDLPEGESELVAGFHSEYSGMRFALFFLGEYIAMIIMSCIAVTCFLGGWTLPPIILKALPFLAVVPGIVWFLLKVYCHLFLYYWIRATVPRFRYDHLMSLGWKVLIPISLVNIVITSIVKYAF